MTRKDYVLLADVIRDLKKQHYTDQGYDYGHAEAATQIIGDLERALASALKQDNMAFNKEKFFGACSLNG